MNGHDSPESISTSAPSSDDIEQARRQAEIDNLVDYLTELRLAERDLMSRFGFRTYDAVKQARVNVAEYLGTGILRRKGFLFCREERIGFAMPEYCPNCGHHNATRIVSPKISMHEAK